MNLVRYNPHPRVAAHTGSRIFDGMLDEFISPLAMITNRPSARELSLKVDIYEKADLIVIEAELPGIKKEDISVDTKGKFLTLGGERKSSTEVTEENSYRRERRYGKFERTFNLPFEVNEDKVKASFTDGVLILEISRPKEQVAKKITIN